MRSISSLFFFLCLLVAGCETLSGDAEKYFSPAKAKLQVFEGDVRTVYRAARVAFKRLDCELTDESGAPGRLEAASRIVTSESLGDSRQLVVQLRLRELEEGNTEVAMTISIQVENASQGGLSAQNKREHGFYEIYFSTLQQVLLEPTADKK